MVPKEHPPFLPPPHTATCGLSEECSFLADVYMPYSVCHYRSTTLAWQIPARSANVSLPLWEHFMVSWPYSTSGPHCTLSVTSVLILIYLTSI